MKEKIIALLLAAVLAVSLMPAASAARLATVEPVFRPSALPESPAQTNGAYNITFSAGDHGVAELYATSANARERVYFLADPDHGYAVDFSNCGYYFDRHEMELYYIGGNLYEIVMPDGDVVLDLAFTKIPTSAHAITVKANEGGMVTLDQTAAKKGESIFVEIIPSPGYSLSTVKAKSGDKWLEGYDLGMTGGAYLYEIFMPDAAMEVQVEFVRNGPYDILTYIDSEGGTVTLSHTSAYEQETVTVTAAPDKGCRVEDVQVSHTPTRALGNNQWSFAMPKHRVEVHVKFAKIVSPVTVTVETGLGGTAALSAETAAWGDTVTLTCTPEPGYRIARVSGAELEDRGQGVYTFPMGDKAVELAVLFLREENPFLDVNETMFFHDAVLWAVDAGITGGMTADSFGPLAVCNRAQVVTFLWRAAGCPEPAATENPFTDVPEGQWFTKAVLWAVEMGITNGMGDGTFGVNLPCNRAQVVTFLHRAQGKPQPRTAEHPFTDVEAGSWYEAPVLWALENSITTGATETTFDPNGQCLRAVVVTFLYRTSQLPVTFPELG